MLKKALKNLGLESSKIQKSCFTGTLRGSVFSKALQINFKSYYYTLYLYILFICLFYLKIFKPTMDLTSEQKRIGKKNYFVEDQCEETRRNIYKQFKFI